MLQTDRLCKDCIYYREEYRTHWAGGDERMPPRCNKLAFDAVSGGEGWPRCEVSRLSDYLCGPAGKFWKLRGCGQYEAPDLNSRNFAEKPEVPGNSTL